jgi:hypothetical protein
LRTKGEGGENNNFMQPPGVAASRLQ